LNYPKKEFNIGETIFISEFEKLISNQSTPITIELLTTKRFWNYNRDITPTFHGLKINDSMVVSFDDRVKEENSGKFKIKLVELILSYSV
jgi:hypothetical protein